MTLTRLSAQLLKTGSNGALPITSSFAITASYAMNGGGGGGDSFPYTGSAIISGSLQVTGSLGVTQGITGSLLGTSSWAQSAVSASTFSGSLQVVGLAQLEEGLVVSGGLYLSASDTTAANKVVVWNSATSQLFTTASLGSTFPFSGSAVITGSLIVSGSGITGSMNIERYTLNTSSLGNASGSMSIDLRNGNFFTATTTNTTTWQFTNTPDSRAVGFVLELTNGGVSASIWPTSTRWPSGIAPSLTVSGVDVLTFITDNAGSDWRGVVSMKDSK